MKHGSSISPERHAGDLGNINANEEGKAIIDIKIAAGSGSTLFGDESILEKTVVIHQLEDDLGKKDDDEESTKTGNAGQRLACAVIIAEANQGEMMKIIIIVLIVIIVLLLILITALIIYCCKR